MSQNIRNILKQYWGYDSFRSSQEEIINSVLDGKNTLALLPTGGGKSICYQVPALAKEGICIVISPLIALMKDQVENLNSRGIKAIAIYSGMNKREIDIALDNCIYGGYKFLYVSPERLQTEIARVRIAKMKVNLIAVDESHCISQWGHDFRPAYLKINELKEIISPEIPFLAVTATANERVIKDICSSLDINSVIKKSFVRENLGYLVLKEENKKERLIKILKKANSSGIVYVNTRRKTLEISKFLNTRGIKADFYHGGLDQKLRDEKQENWLSEKTPIIVSTNAFGMGIDKPNVRIVVHNDPPASPEAYFQEAGRAGRDGEKSFAVLLYKPSDKLHLERFHELEFPEIKTIKTIYNSLGNYYKLAIGGGENTSYEFDINNFSSQFNFDVPTVHHSLSILYSAGYVHLSESLFRPNRIKIKVNNQELYTYQIKHKEHEALLQFLLRTNEGIFDSYCKVELNSMAKTLNQSSLEIVKTLNKLTQFSIIDFLPSSSQPLLTYTVDRIHEDRIKIPKEIYQDRKKVKYEQMSFMIRYCETTKICRSKMLLSYFDETEFENCGKCDFCLNEKKKQLRNKEFLKIEAELFSKLAVESLTIHDLVNSIVDFDEKEVLKVIQWNLDENKLRYDKNNKLERIKKEV